MTDPAPTPEEGIAHAINDLSGQTAGLVRQELDAVKQELIDKSKEWVPAMGLVAVAGLSGIFATASLYRLATRVLDALLPKALATVAGPAIFGGLSVYTARSAWKQIKSAPPPVPVDTARDAAGRIESSLRESSG